MSADRPTHRCRKTNAAVFPEGYDPADLETLPADYWTMCDHEAAIAEMRATRCELLLLTDRTQAADRKADVKVLWAPYREALRELPKTFDPAKPVWPAPPLPLETLT
jgi:hypothetical protein